MINPDKIQPYSPGERFPYLRYPTLNSRSGWLAIICLLLLTIAEGLVALGKPELGLILHSLLLIGLYLCASLERFHQQHHFLLVLSLAPLIRLLSLAMPLPIFPITYWYLVIGIPLFAAAFLVARLTGIKKAMVGLAPGTFPLQLLVSLSGFALGYIEYQILHPAPLIANLQINLIILPALIMLIFTGFLEELIFRGLLQAVAIQHLERWAIPYVAVIFAVLHMGYRSPLDFVFVLGVALAFGWIVKRSGSILGVSLAHGLTNIMLYLVLPFLN